VRFVDIATDSKVVPDKGGPDAAHHSLRILDLIGCTMVSGEDMGQGIMRRIKVAEKKPGQGAAVDSGLVPGVKSR
jgi:hypothetical protein